MIKWMISSSALILTVICLRYIFKGKISLRLQYGLWLLVVIRLLVPVNFGSSMLSIENLTNRMKEEPQIQNVIEFGKQDLSVAYKDVIRRYDDKEIQTAQLENFQAKAVENGDHVFVRDVTVGELVKKVCFYIWLAGVAILGMDFVVMNRILGARVKRTRRRIDIQYSNIPIYISNAVESPCLSGLLRPSIYVTNDVAENTMMLHHSVLHETTHYQHGDLFWAWIRCVCLMIHWYNPLVWWAAILSKRDAELACDEATIKRLGEEERVEYGKTLIQLTCEKRQDLFVTATTMTSDKKGIRERIFLIAEKPKVTLYALIPVIIIAVTATGCAFTGANGIESVASSEEALVKQDENDEGAPVRPEDITSIISATLIYNGTYTITERTILQDLEACLSGSSEISGGADCPFTASLILQLDNGEVLTIFLATDSCSSWLSGGVYYNYSEYEGIEEIYSIFSLDSVVSQFSSAYFAGDVGAVKQYLAASYKEEPETYYGKAERVMISEVKGLSDSGKKKVGEVCTVSVEFKESGNADYYICLRLEAVRESNGWKIQSYGLEG